MFISAFLCDRLQLFQFSKTCAADVAALITYHITSLAAEYTFGLILFQYNTVSVHEDLQRRILIDIQFAAQFYRQNYTAQLINLAYNSGRFHSSMSLSFLVKYQARNANHEV